MRNVHVRKSVFPSDFRALFQTLARVAVASSWELAAGCSATTPVEPAGPGPTQDGNAAGNGRSVDAAQRRDVQATADAAPRVDGAATDAPVQDAAQDPPAIDAAPVLPGPWVPLVCDEGGAWPLEKTSLGKSVDYFAVYSPYISPEQVRALPDGGTRRLLGFTTEVLAGSPCAGAIEPARCLRAIDDQLAATECAVQPCTKFVLVTAGERVTRSEPASLTALLGPVDTETEAAIAALLSSVGTAGCWSPYEVDGAVRARNGTQIRAVEGGYEVESFLTCYGDELSATTMVNADGSAYKLRSAGFCLGRRPDGLLASVPCAASTELGAHFASATHLEAASVFAFEQLARDLTRLDAPRELVRCALRSALEEVGHARTMNALAERFGGEPAEPRIAPLPARSALAVALENAVEGCVRETYGALVACYQAEAALDPQVRAAMTQVFEDETRHAQLAWQIAQWLEPQLSEAEREAVQRARQAAYAQLSSELESSLSHDARLHIGLPDAVMGGALLAQLDAALGLRA